MIEFRITGDEAVRRMLRGELGAFESRVKKFMAKWALGTVATVKEKYLTDPGRPRFRWRVSRRTGRKYISVPRGFYPRPRIGVITGRLRSSFGTPQEAQQARDAVRETGRDRYRFWCEWERMLSMRRHLSIENMISGHWALKLFMSQRRWSSSLRN